ncbi:hypothetical protein LUZ63_011774 [Rhynchospora breviuscula]|uniref:non-specific serine/threonine protein kinase n=1 Tax=Rhynchospora breviuscula TaxID=2022672 RepID=A0A9Q0CJC9_9POAL|nr:hypothetical protein LUZ63_011774 [Rhynchospora breviuscula]
MTATKFVLVLAILATAFVVRQEAKCPKTCSLALGSYYVSSSSLGTPLNLTYIASLFQMTPEEILPFNPEIKNKYYIKVGDRVNVNFSCDCIDNSFLGHTFQYIIQKGDTYERVAKTYYANLTSENFLTKINSYSRNSIPSPATINVTVNCSCGDPSISKQYGLFVTYPLQADENSHSVASAFNLSAAVVDKYNRGTSFSSAGDIVYVPTYDQNGSYHPLSSKRRKPGRALIGIVLGVLAMLLSIGFFCYYMANKRRKADNLCLMSRKSKLSLGKVMAKPGYTIDKSVKFSYEELSKATHGFSMANMIGKGGFGSVYYAELRGEKAAIKKMGTKASKEFLAELKVLTNVHHLNLVKLIGYCIQRGLFLIYEYIDNGNLSQHLRSSVQPPLSWANRVQIALDSARGLEYIHEHTLPVYIHRDIKSDNILIDRNYHAKVADFGLTKIKEAESIFLSKNIVGTFGYIPPEYSRGEISPKSDVYAFGVVLFELISAKPAIITNPSCNLSSEAMGLVQLFDDALGKTDLKESLKELIDPRLGDECHDSMLKMIQLAKACTHKEPHSRPSMRFVVVALMTLSSASESWDIGNLFNNNPGIGNLISSQ